MKMIIVLVQEIINYKKFIILALSR